MIMLNILQAFVFDSIFVTFEEHGDYMAVTMKHGAHQMTLNTEYIFRITTTINVQQVMQEAQS